MRQQLFAAMRSVLLATLVVLPLLPSVHHHAAAAPPQASCALCVVAHLAPGMIAAPLAALLPIEIRARTVFTPTLARSERVRGPIAGRAPPAFSLIAIS